MRFKHCLGKQKQLHFQTVIENNGSQWTKGCFLVNISSICIVIVLKSKKECIPLLESPSIFCNGHKCDQFSEDEPACMTELKLSGSKLYVLKSWTEWNTKWEKTLSSTAAEVWKVYDSCQEYIFNHTEFGNLQICHLCCLFCAPLLLHWVWI